MSKKSIVQQYYDTRTSTGWKSALFSRNFEKIVKEAADKLVLGPELKKNTIEQTIRIGRQATVSVVLI